MLLGSENVSLANTLLHKYHLDSMLLGKENDSPSNTLLYKDYLDSMLLRKENVMLDNTTSRKCRSILYGHKTFETSFVLVLKHDQSEHRM